MPDSSLERRLESLEGWVEEATEILVQGQVTFAALRQQVIGLDERLTAIGRTVDEHTKLLAERYAPPEDRSIDQVKLLTDLRNGLYGRLSTLASDVLEVKQAVSRPNPIAIWNELKVQARSERLRNVSCELCGHTGLEMVSTCGYRTAPDETGGRSLYLCHSPGTDHDCYARWMNGERPEHMPPKESAE